MNFCNAYMRIFRIYRLQGIDRNRWSSCPYSFLYARVILFFFFFALCVAEGYTLRKEINDRLQIIHHQDQGIGHCFDSRPTRRDVDRLWVLGAQDQWGTTVHGDSAAASCAFMQAKVIRCSVAFTQHASRFRTLSAQFAAVDRARLL